MPRTSLLTSTAEQPEVYKYRVSAQVDLHAFCSQHQHDSNEAVLLSMCSCCTRKAAASVGFLSLISAETWASHAELALSKERRSGLWPMVRSSRALSLCAKVLPGMPAPCTPISACLLSHVPHIICEDITLKHTSRLTLTAQHGSINRPVQSNKVLQRACSEILLEARCSAAAGDQAKGPRALLLLSTCCTSERPCGDVPIVPSKPHTSLVEHAASHRLTHMQHACSQTPRLLAHL